MKTERAEHAANISFELTEHFKKDLKVLGKKYRSIGDDLDHLLEALEEEPNMGTPLGQDCYKIRMAISSKKAGKRGGARVVTCVKIVRQKIYLLTIFDKGEQETVSDEELKTLLKEAGLE